MTRRMAAILALDAAGYTARMAADRDATLAALRRVFRDVVRPGIAAEDGRVVKLTGDGALAEFPSAAGAVLAAAAIQRALSDDPVRLRAGVHVGDVTMEGGDVFGDAVNIAARLEAAAPEGGVLVSRAAADMAGGGLDVTLEPRGALRLKGVPRPLESLAVALDGARRDAAVADLSAAQEVRFAVSADGTRLAWAAFGEGPTLVKAPNFIQSLDGDLETLQGAYLLDLARHRRV
ncbi:MAG TPA: adenylate/guanylate cyclase domain-containing protein, partial [Paracoccaceae bacterium]|nr:adenylate/guanylate cyclase domain-containing protein [Paracoccaceae bacterium]